MVHLDPLTQNTTVNTGSTNFTVNTERRDAESRPSRGTGRGRRVPGVIKGLCGDWGLVEFSISSAIWTKVNVAARKLYQGLVASVIVAYTADGKASESEVMMAASPLSQTSRLLVYIASAVKRSERDL